MCWWLLAQKSVLASEENKSSTSGQVSAVWITSCWSSHCWWFTVAFISFTLAWAQSVCGWCLIARQHMVPFASDHSNTSLSNCVQVPAPSHLLQQRRTQSDRLQDGTYSVKGECATFLPSGEKMIMVTGKCKNFTEQLCSCIITHCSTTLIHCTSTSIYTVEV